MLTYQRKLFYILIIKFAAFATAPRRGFLEVWRVLGTTFAENVLTVKAEWWAKGDIAGKAFMIPTVSDRLIYKNGPSELCILEAEFVTPRPVIETVKFADQCKWNNQDFFV